MPETTVVARDKDQTVIFRCSSGNIHVVHQNTGICMSPREFLAYSGNVQKALDSIEAAEWDSPWVTVHYREMRLSMLVDEFIRFGTTIQNALAVSAAGAISPEDRSERCAQRDRISLN